MVESVSESRMHLLCSVPVHRANAQTQSDARPTSGVGWRDKRHSDDVEGQHPLSLRLAYPHVEQTHAMSSNGPPAGDAAAPVPAADPSSSTSPPRPASPEIPAEVLSSSIDDITTRTRLLDNDLKVMKSETMRLMHEQTAMKEKIKDNADKIRQNKILPFLVGNVVEVSCPSRDLSGEKNGFAD